MAPELNEPMEAKAERGDRTGARSLASTRTASPLVLTKTNAKLKYRKRGKSWRLAL